MSAARRVPASVRVVGWVGAALFWAVQLTLLLALEMPLADTILLAVLLVGVPAVSIAQLPLLKDAWIERLPAYWGSIVTLWLLGSACWLVGTRAGGAPAVGLVGIGPLALVGWTLGLTAAALLTILVFREVALRTGIRESAVLRELLPRTPRERRVFALLSVAAGSGEELAYRGYAIPLLAPLVGTGGAVLLTSVVFGVLHGYQGWLGTVRTAIMGGVLAGGFLASGSLWPCILAHTLIDLAAGLVLGDWLLPPDVEPSGAAARASM